MWRRLLASARLGKVAPLARGVRSGVIAGLLSWIFQAGSRGIPT